MVGGRGSRSAVKITAKKLCSMGKPTLEDLLAFVNNGKYDRFFLKRPRESPDGSRETFTKKGGKLYDDLVTLVYAIARCVGSTDDVVKRLDEIAGDMT